MHIRQGNLIMNDWFTVEKIDTETFAISEYQHWEETHCYLICGKEKAVLIDTGSGISNIRSVTIVRMEVPCCGGLQRAAENALKNSGKFIPWQVVTISRDGRVLEE